MVYSESLVRALKFISYPDNVQRLEMLGTVPDPRKVHSLLIKELKKAGFDPDNNPVANSYRRQVKGAYQCVRKEYWGIIVLASAKDSGKPEAEEIKFATNTLLNLLLIYPQERSKLTELLDKGYVTYGDEQPYKHVPSDSDGPLAGPC
jgi:hypothetical protein